MRVLVVHASGDVAEVMALILRGSGHECAIATDGREAWTLIESADWDCLVLSPDLPGVASSHLLRLAKRHADSRIRAVWVEDGADEHSRIAAYRVGADCILVRPFAPAELVAAVEAPLWARVDQF